MSVTVHVEGSPYSLRECAPDRSKVLAECRDAAAGGEAPSVTELPLKRSWLEAWDQESCLTDLSLEDQLGVVKVRDRCCFEDFMLLLVCSGQKSLQCEAMLLLHRVYIILLAHACACDGAAASSRALESS
jgi:hypothetical protein